MQTSQSLYGPTFCTVRHCDRLSVGLYSLGFILPALFLMLSVTCGPLFFHTFRLPGRFESKRSVGHQLFSIVYPSVASSK